MIAIDLANAVFLVCLVAGGVLLLIALVLDDELSSLLLSLRLQRRSNTVPVLTYLFAFLAAFGFGGLVATRVLRSEAAPAAALGVVAGLVGVAATFAAVGLMERRREARRSVSGLDDFVGHRGRVTSFIKAGGQGTVAVTAGSSVREFVATADLDLDEGSVVVVRDVDEAASTLVVTLASHSTD